MRGFARRTPVEAAWRWIDAQVRPLPAEAVSIWQAAGRVLAEEVLCSHPLPGFDRAMMDGFAVRAADTQGATPFHRLPLRIVGQAWPGRPAGVDVAAGQAVVIMTGAPLPAGADAVLPAERAEVEGETVWALDEVPPGRNVGFRGEDVAEGATVFRPGRILRPQDVALLSALGHATVLVVRKPQVAVVITGSELLAAGTPAQGFQIADANGPMLAALIRRDGGLPVFGSTSCVAAHSLETAKPSPDPPSEGFSGVCTYLLPDAPAAILSALLNTSADLILVSGGSSVGQEDYVPQLLAQHGELAIHGVAMRPSSPTGMGRIAGRLVFLLPGNPVSCLCAYDFFAGRAIRQLGGLPAEWPYRSVRLPLVRKLVSQLGRVDYARVRITADGVEPLAIGGASLLRSVTEADGFVVVPAQSEGYPAGADVEVFLYEPLAAQDACGLATEPPKAP
jgi:molybdopterin molybdotransferase